MASVKRYYNKEGEITSIQLRVYRGKDENGKQLKPYQKSVRIEKGTSERKLKKIEQQEALLFERECRCRSEDEANILFRDFANQFLDKKAISGASPSTLAHYRNMLELRILDEFGYLKLQSINGAMLDRFYKKLMSDNQNKRTGKGLSAKTVLEHHRLLSAIFAQAKKQHIITNNPANDATPPTPPKKIPNYYQPEQLAKIRAAFDKEPIFWRLMGYMLMTYGDRRSEFAGIRCSDIDFSRGIITLRGAVLYDSRNGVYAKDTLKNGKSRELPITREIEPLMKEYLAWRTEQREIWGRTWQESGYLFTSMTGGMLNPDNITHYLNRMSKRLQAEDPTFPSMNPHAFRHTVVSMLLHSGVDVVSVAAYVGDDPATITAHYAHIINEGTRRAANTMSGLVFAG